MDLGFNWVDLVIIIFLTVFCVEAIGRHFLLEVLDLLSFILAFFLSFGYYNIPAKYIETQFSIPHGLALVLGFMAIWFLSETVFFLLVRLFYTKLPDIKFTGSSVMAVFPAFLRSITFIAITLIILATFPIQPVIKKAVLDSKMGSFILKNAYQLEQPVKNVFGSVANDSLTFLTIKPKTDERINLGFKTDNFSTDSIDEISMMNLINRERTDRGLRALRFDEKLRYVGRIHSADMFKNGYFSHYSPEGKTVADRALDANIDYLVVGENLAYAPNLELAHKGLMNSEGHRANILSADYGRIGVGVMNGGVYGKMFTQVFAD